MYKVTQELSQPFLDIFPWFIYGKDKSGDPVMYTTLPEPNLDGVDIEKMKLGRLVQCESSQRVQRELNVGVAAKHTVVTDMSALSFGHLKPSIVSMSKKIVEPDFFFPAICKQIVLVSMPAVAEHILSVALKLVPSRIMRSKPIIGKSLTNFIDLNQIPEEYGGTCKIPPVWGGAVFPDHES